MTWTFFKWKLDMGKVKVELRRYMCVKKKTARRANS